MVLLSLILLTSLFAYGCGKQNGNLEGTTQILEIENTEEVISKVDSDSVEIRKHYIIVNPPEDLYELKKAVENFYVENPIDSKIVAGENKLSRIEVNFYRESERLPQDWQPNETYFSVERLEDHVKDLIAVIQWSDANPQNRYYIMRKSSDKKDYGTSIERIEYIEDEVVE